MKKPDVIFVDFSFVNVWSDEQWKNYCDNEGYYLEKYSSGSYVL